MQDHWLVRKGIPRHQFMQKVARQKDGCWLWMGTVDRDGYGRLMVNRVRWGAHRLTYVAYKGPIETGMVIDHLCRVPNCVNPDHLEAVTTRENVLRGAHVKRGLSRSLPRTGREREFIPWHDPSGRKQRGTVTSKISSTGETMWSIRFVTIDGSRRRIRLGADLSFEDVKKAARRVVEVFNRASSQKEFPTWGDFVRSVENSSCTLIAPGDNELLKLGQT